jgi:F-type H+-transporting ATPase subunit delta
MAKISAKNIAEAIYQATEGKNEKDVEAVAKRTVEMLAAKRMLGRSKEILEALENILYKKSGTVRARIFSSKKLEPKEKSQVEEDIKKRYSAKQVVSEYFENKELLGGVRIEVGDEVLDNTYKNKLEQLEKFLTTRQ